MKTRHQLISILVAVALMLAILVPTVMAEGSNEDIRAIFSGDMAFAQIEALVSFGPRVAGTDAEKAAADYIAAEMESYGLDVEIQEFDIYSWDELSAPELDQVSPNPTNYQQGVVTNETSVQRPVYFAVTVDDLMGFEPFLNLEGLVFQFDPDSTRSYDPPAMDSQ